jgi:hypothetical protein
MLDLGGFENLRGLRKRDLEIATLKFHADKVLVSIPQNI